MSSFFPFFYINGSSSKVHGWKINWRKTARMSDYNYVFIRVDVCSRFYVAAPPCDNQVSQQGLAALIVKDVLPLFRQKSVVCVCDQNVCMRPERPRGWTPPRQRKWSLTFHGTGASLPCYRPWAHQALVGLHKHAIQSLIGIFTEETWLRGFLTLTNIWRKVEVNTNEFTEEGGV